MNKKKRLLNSIDAHIDVIDKNKDYFIKKIEIATKTLMNALEKGNKIIWCGNGGSASQANHLSAELVGGMFKEKNDPLKSICINTDTAFITAWSNDDNYENIFSRQVDAIGLQGDVLVTLSTSGNSQNIINAVKLSNVKGIKTIAMTGNDGGQVAQLSDININVDSQNTARIQETHIMIGHMICELIENPL